MAVQNPDGGEAWVDSANNTSRGALAFLTLLLSSKSTLGKSQSGSDRKRQGSGKAVESSERYFSIERLSVLGFMVSPRFDNG
jgi:hypothetical protein